jgi:transcriptional regulator with XRE-family HTH domain
MFLGKNIKKIREAQGMSREAFFMRLANAGLSKSYPTIQNWELGRSRPNVANLAVIANVLDVSVDKLLN